MKKAMLPLNLDLLVPTPEQLRLLRPVTTLDIIDGPGGNFHEDGLFSTLTFGRVGDPDRDRRFGYIDVKIPIMHPVVYTRLIKLKSLYGDILSGRAYARFNPEIGDFEKATELDGQTGYAFFASHWDLLDPKKTGSAIRDLRVTLINKYRDKAFLDKLLVLPAGLRDAEIDATGRLSMDEVNELYQKVLMLTRTLPDRMTARDDLSLHDRTRYSLTLRLVEIYEHFEKLLSGKGGFIQRRWASRRVFNTTRNVLSSLDTSAQDLDARNRPQFNDVVIGLYQAAKNVLPKAIYHLKTGVVGEIFQTQNNNVELVEPKSLKRTWVEVANEDVDRWGTDEGLEKVIHELSVLEKRNQPVKIADHYLALVYLDDRENYKILRGIEDLPEGYNKKWVRPITYMELIYLSGVAMWNKTHAFVTRYPVENFMSSIPCRVYVKTTVTGEMRHELDENFERRGDDYVALEYPVFEGDDAQYHDSTSINPSRLGPLGADFDGDTVSVLSAYSKESAEEAERYFKSRAAYLRAGGGLAFSVDVHTLGLALRFMTGPQ
jgi:hypothetical protein